MNALIHRIYSSTATLEFKEHQIPELLAQLRPKNARLGVSGMLLYIEQSFFQVLEGAPAAIDALYETIALDPRHQRVTQIIREPISERSFGEWSMGFSAVGIEEARALSGSNDFFTDASCLNELDGGRAKKLLHAFRDGRWRTERTGMFTTPGRVA